MVRVLASEDPAGEKTRLLGQAKHCRELARALADHATSQEMVSLARSYEAKSAMVAISSVPVKAAVAGETRSIPQQMQRLIGSVR